MYVYTPSWCVYTLKIPCQETQKMRPVARQKHRKADRQLQIKWSRTVFGKNQRKEFYFGFPSEVQKHKCLVDFAWICFFSHFRINTYSILKFLAQRKPTDRLVPVKIVLGNLNWSLILIVDLNLVLDHSWS